MYAPDLPSYNIGTGYLPPQSREDLRIAFKAGAEWMRGQGVTFKSERNTDMEAPDKIYIQSNAHDRWFEGNKPNDNFVEYIRKNALIEWAEDFKAKTGWYEIEVAMDDLIDKLNSM